MEDVYPFKLFTEKDKSELLTDATDALVKFCHLSDSLGRCVSFLDPHFTQTWGEVDIPCVPLLHRPCVFPWTGPGPTTDRLPHQNTGC
jgi:hypothetical protein